MAVVIWNTFSIYIYSDFPYFLYFQFYDSCRNRLIFPRFFRNYKKKETGRPMLSTLTFKTQGCWGAYNAVKEQCNEKAVSLSLQPGLSSMEQCHRLRNQGSHLLTEQRHQHVGQGYPPQRITKNYWTILSAASPNSPTPGPIYHNMLNRPKPYI